MLELLFLLLPIAAGYGWFMGRRSIRLQEKRKKNSNSSTYASSLAYLIETNSDGGVDQFVKLIEVDNQTFDTHLALGSLFRHQGEVDKAITIHENLTQQQQLTLEQLDLAKIELGRDYLTAGVYNQAERIFQELIEQPLHSHDAEKSLLEIYSLTHEWEKALNLINAMNKTLRATYQRQAAHYCCELANLNPNQADKLLYRAITIDPDCGRAWLERLFSCAKAEDWQGAEQNLNQLLRSEPQLYSLFIAQFDPDRLGQARFAKWGLEAINRGAGSQTVTLYSQFLIEQAEFAKAERLLTGVLQKEPSLEGFRQLMNVYIQQGEQQGGSQMRYLERLVARQSSSIASIQCKVCGFQLHSQFWQCPSCHEWGSATYQSGLISQ